MSEQASIAEPVLPMTDEEATDLDWWFLDLLRSLVFKGERIEPAKRP